LALRNGRAILLAEANLSRAAAEHDQARSVFRPQIVLGSGVAYTKGFPLSIEGSAPSIFQVGASQALFDVNLRNLERQAGRMQEAGAKSLEEARDQVLASTVATYLDLDRSRRSLEYVRGEAESLEAAVNIIEERVAAGLEPRVESTRARLDSARARSALETLQNRIALLEFELRDLTGIPQTEAIQTQPAEIPLGMGEATLEEWIARAQANYPGLQALDEEVRSKEFQVKSEQGSLWPRVNLVGQYGLFSKINNYDEFFQRFERNNLTLGVSIVVPLYQRERYSARRTIAESELAAARYRREEAAAAIARQVRELWATAQQQSASREVVRLELELARSSLDAVLAQYDEGRVNRLAVEQARQEENRAWVNLLMTDYESEKARLELLRLTGDIRNAIL
jgi:outer membrane protein TolC